MQAITTKYFGPTTQRGSRVKASCASGWVIIGWDDAISGKDNHILAAKKLAAKFDWDGAWHAGSTTEGFVFVATDDAAFITESQRHQLERLIKQYEQSIWADDFDEKRTEQLMNEVETLADKINYTDHRRLMALHTQFERRVSP